MNREVICLGLRDYHDSCDDLKKTIDYFRSIRLEDFRAPTPNY